MADNYALGNINTSKLEYIPGSADVTMVRGVNGVCQGIDTIPFACLVALPLPTLVRGAQSDISPEALFISDRIKLHSAPPMRCAMPSAAATARGRLLSNSIPH